MKTKILLSFAIFFCAAITSNAQINEGSYLLGGSIGFNSSKNQNGNIGKNESFNTNIQFGKVIKDNNVAGIILSYGYTNNTTSYKSYQYGAGVFYRKYKPLAKGFYFFGEADAVYNYSRATYEPFQIGSDGSRYTYNTGTLSFTPGISYAICKRMQMELSMLNLFSVSYGGTKTENSSSTSSSISTTKGNNFSAGVNLNSNLVNNFGIGFKFLLGK
ncbi:MAG TPA: hypothetical protein VIJ95_11890 [Hanamia sp.]